MSSSTFASARKRIANDVKRKKEIQRPRNDSIIGEAYSTARFGNLLPKRDSKFTRPGTCRAVQSLREDVFKTHSV
jgi:hypothetical protein